MSEEIKYWWDNNPTCVSGVQWNNSTEEEKESFLGKSHYSPSLENIYLGLGITGAAQYE